METLHDYITIKMDRLTSSSECSFNHFDRIVFNLTVEINSDLIKKTSPVDNISLTTTQ